MSFFRAVEGLLHGNGIGAKNSLPELYAVSNQYGMSKSSAKKGNSQRARRSTCPAVRLPHRFPGNRQSSSERCWLVVTKHVSIVSVEENGQDVGAHELRS